MRRTELIEGVEQVQQTLELSKLKEAIEKAIKEDKPGSPISAETISLLLKAWKQYSVQAQSFTNAAKRIAQIIDLTSLEDSSIWGLILQASSEERKIFLLHTLNLIKFALNYLPNMAELLEPEGFKFIELSSMTNVEQRLLTVIVIEEENRFSSPIRLSQVLESINTLYQACATLEGLPSEGLCVVACDSGSDKSFDFFGVAKVIECVKEVILSLWDRIVFFKEKKLAHQIDLIAQSLPIIEQINFLEEEKRLGPEQAELLRRAILGGVEKFLASGAIIPEINDHSFYNPRLLMAPEPKLLGEASDDSATHQSLNEEVSNSENTDELNNSKELGLDNLTDEERSHLFSLLKKTQKKRDITQHDSAGEPED